MLRFFLYVRMRNSAERSMYHPSMMWYGTPSAFAGAVRIWFRVELVEALLADGCDGFFQGLTVVAFVKRNSGREPSVKGQQDARVVLVDDSHVVDVRSRLEAAAHFTQDVSAARVNGRLVLFEDG